MLLFKTSIGYFKGHPFQVIMHILGIALGVALVVSIDIANTSVEKSFQLSTESITGKTTHQIMGLYGPIDQSLYVKLRTQLGIRKSAPVITGYTVVDELKKKKMRLLGVDPFAESGFRGYMADSAERVPTDILTSLLIEPGRVLISESLALENQLKPGDTLTLNFGSRKTRVKISGLLQGSGDNNAVLSAMIYTDISTAQELMELGDKLSHIDLIIPAGNNQILESIESILPKDISIIPALKRSTSIKQMSRSFEFNLMAFSMLALLVGMFLIYNTVSFSVIQRRKLIGTLRALGVTRKEILIQILTETWVLSIIGTLLGLLLGIFLGTLTVKMVSQTVSGFYFVLTVTQFHISALSLAKGAILGLAVSLVAALFPALEANRIQPAEAMQRSFIESKTLTRLPKIFALGLIIVAAGLGLLFIPSKSIAIGFTGTAFIVLGFSFCVPFLSVMMVKILLPLFFMIFGISGKMAARNIPRSISRTGVSIAALMVAVCVYIGVGLMIVSFRGSLMSWIDDQIRGDIHIGSSNETNRHLSARIIRSFKNEPDVAVAHTYYINEIHSGTYASTVLFITNSLKRNYRWIWSTSQGEPLNTQFNQGAIFVSETFAWKHHIVREKTSIIRLNTPKGPVDFPVAGVFSDFFVKGGRILMNRQIHQKYWQTNFTTNIELFLKPGVDPEQAVSTLKQNYDGDMLTIVSQTSLRRDVMKLFDRTFAITVALQILSAVVAFIGILNTIMSLMHERQHEIGILRANGLTRGQLWKLILIESGIIGFLAGLLAIPLGSVLAWILIVVINKRSFGWTLDFYSHPEILFQAIILSFLAALLAGVYPAWKTGKLNIIQAIRAE